jgi:hypothetical protein
MTFPHPRFTCFLRRAAPGAGLLAGACFTFAADPFTRVASDPVVSGAGSTAAAWGDFNNDGYPDLLVGTYLGASSLYRNNGNGTFSLVSSGPITTDSGAVYGAAWADYDNDGHLDLYLNNNQSSFSNTNDWLYHNNGDGTFAKVTSGPVVTSGGNGNNCGWADYDGDGYVDLFVANSDGKSYLFHNNKDGTFTSVSNAITTGTLGNSQGGAWADYDNDGKPDLYVSRVGSPCVLFHNDGNGNFSKVTSGTISSDSGGAQGTSWADYDNSGYLSLFVINNKSQNFLYHNNGDGTFTRITSGPPVTDIGDGHGCAWGDYDNDGYLDLLVVNRHGTNFLYRNNRDGTFTRDTTSSLSTDVGDSWAAAWADYDNDGALDVFVTQYQGYTSRLYHNNGNSNGWLTVSCTGTTSNRAAIGAKVRVHATIWGKPMWQVREISGGSGLGTQDDLRPHFGLGDAAVADEVRIEWPSGIVQTFKNVTAKTILRVTEAAVSITANPVGQTAMPGGRATFTVGTSGSDLTYQWQVSTDSGGNWANLADGTSAALGGATVTGSTTATLTLSAVTLAGSGAQVRSLINSGALTSTAATLTVKAAVASYVDPSGETIAPVTAAPASAVTAGTQLTLAVSSHDSSVNVQWQLDGADIPGATGSTYTPGLAASGQARTSAVGHGDAGHYTVKLTATTSGEVAFLDLGALTVTQDAWLINLSARAEVGTGGNVLIGGFVTTGSGAKSMLVRGAGPALGLPPFNLGAALTTPHLDLYQGSTVIVSADSWDVNLAPVMDAVGAFGWTSGSRDTAVLRTFAPGLYTAIESGAQGSTGIGVMEIYDADAAQHLSPGAPTNRLSNISARAKVGTGGDVLIGGFVIDGHTSLTVLIRGVGSALAAAPFNLAGTLNQPVVTLYDGAGAPIASNAGWNNALQLGSSALVAGSNGGIGLRQALTADFTGTGAFPLAQGATDSALVATLPPGVYTVIISGAASATGIALVEIYER